MVLGVRIRHLHLFENSLGDSIVQASWGSPGERKSRQQALRDASLTTWVCERKDAETRMPMTKPWGVGLLSGSPAGGDTYNLIFPFPA